MKVQSSLPEKVVDRYQRLLNSNHSSWCNKIKVTRDWLKDQRSITAILDEAVRREPTLDVDGWVDQAVQSRGHIQWTNITEHGQAVLSWRMLDVLADAGDNAGLHFALSGKTNTDEMVFVVMENVLRPFFEYVVEHLQESSTVLHILARYIRIVEWFDRDELESQFNAEPSKGEEIYSKHLRRFLFTEGLEMPIAESSSPSGESDALNELSGEDPLVCEVKIFDANNRGKVHVATGVNQALQYAQDYGVTVAHLVVVNLSGRTLEFSSDGPSSTWPPYLELGGVRIFLISARGNRISSASKLGKAGPIVFSREDLIVQA